MKKLYFAHPINTYGTDLERDLLVAITFKFPDHEIVNPSDQIHKDMVAKMRADDPRANVMPYFIELVESCNDAVVLPFGDGRWGAGVWAEADQIHWKGGSVWVINPTNHFVTYVSKVRLSVEETRARIRNPDGTTKPYE